MLLAYVEDRRWSDEILDSDLPDEAWTAQVLADYFPTPLRERFADADGRAPAAPRDRHHAAGQRGGQPGRHLVPVYRADRGDRGQRGRRRSARTWWSGTSSGCASSGAPSRPWTTRSRRRRRPRSTWRSGGCSTGRCAGWSPTGGSPIDVAGEIARLRPGVAALLPRLDDAVPRPGARRAAQHAADAGRRAGVPDEIADWATRVMYGFGLLDIVEVAHATGRDVDEVADGLLRAVASGSGSTTCCRGSPRCRARTAGRRWPGWRCATTCTPRWPALTAEVLDRDRRPGDAPRPGSREWEQTQRGIDRPGPQRHRRVRRVPGRPGRRSRCCCARSAPWSAPPPPDLRWQGGATRAIAWSDSSALKQGACRAVGLCGGKGAGETVIAIDGNGRIARATRRPHDLITGVTSSYPTTQ